MTIVRCPKCKTKLRVPDTGWKHQGDPLSTIIPRDPDRGTPRRSLWSLFSPYERKKR